MPSGRNARDDADQDTNLLTPPDQGDEVLSSPLINNLIVAECGGPRTQVELVVSNLNLELSSANKNVIVVKIGTVKLRIR